MVIIFVIGGIVVGALFLSLLSSKGRRAALGATPLGAYMQAVKKGASTSEAIYDAIQFLRYRDPWRALSDSDLSAAVEILAQLKNPKDFIEVVIEVEERHDLVPVLDGERLSRFVELVNRARDQESTPN